jgi:hypothetical protein
MSVFKFLIDTNIVIGLEDNRPVEAGLTDLTRRCRANGVRLFIDAAVDEDVQRDADLARRGVTLSKLEKFERLAGIVYPDDSELGRRYGPINSVNDRSDCRLLFCLERKAADFLITRDIGLRRRARRVGFGDSVLSLEDALVWLRQTFDPAAVELPYVVEREAYAIDKSDPLFDGLRADYRASTSGTTRNVRESTASAGWSTWAVHWLAWLFGRKRHAAMRRSSSQRGSAY